MVYAVVAIGPTPNPSGRKFVVEHSRKVAGLRCTGHSPQVQMDGIRALM
jgi:hypothetical protein